MQQKVPISKQITSYNHSGRIGVMIEIACETIKPFEDDGFSIFTHDMAKHIAAEDPKDISELLQQPFIKQPEITVRQLIERQILKYEENMKVCRFIRWDIENTTHAPDDLPPKSPVTAMKVVK